MRPEVEGGRGQAGADRLCLRLGLAPSELVPLLHPRPIRSSRPAGGRRFARELVPLHPPRPLRHPLRDAGLGACAPAQ